MIVISGALVLVALVLLIIGVVGPDLTFVYASIAVSLVSLVFLVVGILQRRGETAPAAETAGAPAPQVQPADAAGVTAVVPTQEARASMRKVAQEPPAADTADEELQTGGTVLVVQGRPRYHVEGCRYLSGKAAEAVDVLDAREEGFSPCGVCKPDDALVAAAEAEPVEEQLPAGGQPADEDPVTEELVLEEPAVEEPAVEEPVVEEDVPGVEVAPARAATRRAATRKAPAKKAPAKAAATRAVKAPAAKAPGRAAVKAAAAPKPAAAAKPPTKAPAKAPAKAAAAAAAAPVRAGSVVVIPDRGKFHKPQCRFVRDVDGAEVMSKTAASRSGYAACGVCKP